MDIPPSADGQEEPPANLVFVFFNGGTNKMSSNERIIREATKAVIKSIEQQEKDNKGNKGKDFEREKKGVQELSDFLLFINENKLWKNFR